MFGGLECLCENAQSHDHLLCYRVTSFVEELKSVSKQKYVLGSIRMFADAMAERSVFSTIVNI
jgi:hypothetical protein